MLHWDNKHRSKAKPKRHPKKFLHFMLSNVSALLTILSMPVLYERSIIYLIIYMHYHVDSLNCYIFPIFSKHMIPTMYGSDYFSQTRNKLSTKNPDDLRYWDCTRVPINDINNPYEAMFNDLANTISVINRVTNYGGHLIIMSSALTSYKSVNWHT